MKFYSLLALAGTVFSIVASQIMAGESISGKDTGYRTICLNAARDPSFLQNFRSMGIYRSIVELSEGDAYAKYLIHASPKVMGKLEQFRRLDSIGNPPIVDYPTIGKFSATNVRYIVFADQITKLFSLPCNPKIVEIGAGFGGQCYTLSCLIPSFHYYFYDLPEVEALITKMIEKLEIKNAKCIPFESEIPEEKIDLLISNYAFSECDREIQLAYFNKVVKKADRGYIIFNQIANEVYDVHSLSVDEFVQLLKSNGVRPKVLREIPSSAPGNLLITWDKTKH